MFKMFLHAWIGQPGLRHSNLNLIINILMGFRITRPIFPLTHNCGLVLLQKLFIRPQHVFNLEMVHAFNLEMVLGAVTCLPLFESLTHCCKFVRSALNCFRFFEFLNCCIYIVMIMFPLHLLTCCASPDNLTENCNCNTSLNIFHEK